MASEQLELTMNQVQQLSAEVQLQLTMRVAERLAEAKNSGERRYLVYGEYRNASGHESSEEHFKLAEWHSSML